MRLLLLFSCLFYLNLAFSQDCESPKGKTKRICNNASKLIKKGKYYKAQQLLRKIKNTEEIVEVYRLKAIAFCKYFSASTYIFLLKLISPNK
jgi:hypothetical protein